MGTITQSLCHQTGGVLGSDTGKLTLSPCWPLLGVAPERGPAHGGPRALADGEATDADVKTEGALLDPPPLPCLLRKQTHLN